jgi:hypothetical protein
MKPHKRHKRERLLNRGKPQIIVDDPGSMSIQADKIVAGHISPAQLSATTIDPTPRPAKPWRVLVGVMFAYVWMYLVQLRMILTGHAKTEVLVMHHEGTGMIRYLALIRRRDVHNTNKVEADVIRNFWCSGPVSMKDSYPVKEAKSTLSL